jgi:PIN domain nuclease of toxin-antitoxin system
MNKYIIDTHILLWLIFKPDQIKKSKLVILEDTDNEIFATSISFWEISLKYGLGKLDLQGLEPKDIPIVTKEMGIEILEIHHELMSSYNELPQVKNHKDPFDRIMIWHCIKNNCFFVTQDSKLEDYQKFGLRYLS